MSLISVTIIDGPDAKWGASLDQVYPLLRASGHDNLFPQHFALIVLPKIGGKLVLVGEDESPDAVGFLFPRKLAVAPASMGGSAPAETKLYTLRLHQLDNGATVNRDAVLQAVNQALGQNGTAVLYRDGFYNFHPSSQQLGQFDEHLLTVGRPSEDEAGIVRSLHQQIWSAEHDALYPVDIHSREFGLATDLVMRVGDEVAGFLMGFYKSGGAPLPPSWWEEFNGGWRIESQVMGVLPQYRGNQIGYLLKRAQGELAVREGIGIVNWTADPLQFPNAVLNFSKLGAVAFDFYPDLYPFRNELNRVPASRFGLTWLVGTNRVRTRPLERTASGILDVAAENISKVNSGTTIMERQPNASRIAIEIPSDWTTVQRENVAEALQWRSSLDDILSQIIGINEGQYTVTGVGRDGARCYLIAERSTNELWEKLTQ